MNDFNKRWRKQERKIRIESLIFAVLMTALVVAVAIVNAT